MTWPGCQITIAADGAEALARFSADPADLVVLDVSMPSPDGFEVCRRIRDAAGSCFFERTNLKDEFGVKVPSLVSWS